VLADLLLIAGLLAAAAATLAWLALALSGPSRTDGTSFLPRAVWLLLCLFSPVGAVIYLVAHWAWRRRRRARGVALIFRRGG